ncbi:hypothetical protein J4H92_07000 [Leucobacter weissii]|uniref:Uncharacterized protein n=1 Tax=Leucobacter weissii TaxID=1983706 RepID=A0A939MK38_9MICO|nr:hypothetical protein [Leucobacter weissii]MBO1901700.1 hypothetical protein [Leucobacter weissii]
MRWNAFLDAYSRSAPRRRARFTAFAEVLAPSDDYATRWGELLFDTLSGRPPRLQELAALSQEYSAWVNETVAFIDANLEEVEALIRDDEKLGGLFIAEAGFHRLNGHAQWSWAALIDLDHTLHMHDMLTTRTRFLLATQGLAMSNGRERAVKEDFYFDRELDSPRAWGIGRGTEIDAYIALLDLSRRDPALVVLPAPPQFERLAHRNNADFIVVDTRARRARGVQVKTSVRAEHRSAYDPARVTLIDGTADLHNTRAMRTNPLSSDRKAVAWPGLISAHFVLELPMKASHGWMDEREIVRYKLAARHFAGSVPSRNRLAFATIGERILRDLRAESG